MEGDCVEIKKIIDGLQFTIDMFMTNPATGEVYKMPRNDEDATTIDACREAVRILGHLERGAIVSDYRTYKVLESIKNKCENSSYCHDCPYANTICFDIPPSDWDLETIKPKLLKGGKHDGN